jgi:hypothetical protein
VGVVIESSEEVFLLSRRTLGLLVALQQPPEDQSWACPCCALGRMHVVKVNRIVGSSTRAPPHRPTQP